jgi:serine/threonine protein kinase
LKDLSCTVQYITYGLEKVTRNHQRGYLVMEKCLCSLKDIFEGKVELPLQEGETKEDALHNISYEFLKALARIHASETIIHRDLHPGNIFVYLSKRDGLRIIKLGDFGVPKQLHRKKATDTATRGHEDYIPAEYQGVNEQLGLTPENAEAIDMFAAGIIIAWIYGGRHIYHIPGEPDSMIPGNIKLGKKSFDAILENQLPKPHRHHQSRDGTDAYECRIPSTCRGCHEALCL